MVAYPELAAIRLGYGLSPLSDPPGDAAAVLSSVADAAPDRDALRTRDHEEFAATRKQISQRIRAGDQAARQELVDLRRKVNQLYFRQMQLRFARAVGAPAGFGERLVQFWSDHFTTRIGDPFRRLLTVAHVDEAIRPHLNGHFADMLFAAETHPAMLIYLDQNSSVGPHSRAARNRPGRHLGLNENLAREMIELHTLGVGGDYSQRDVRQLAELLTGLRFRPGQDRIFRPELAEPGAETVLGESYGVKGQASLADIRAVCEDLTRHPSTAQHMARKLAVHFVGDEPPQPLVRRLADVWSSSNGHLPECYAVLAEASELDSQFRSKVRQPFDFMASSMRALGLSGDDVRAFDIRQVRNWLQFPLVRMGQRWGQPTGPDGWPEEAGNWITPQGLAARIDWATRIAPRMVTDLPKPAAFLQTALGSTASEPLRWAVPKAETAREAMVVVLASSDFNRR